MNETVFDYIKKNETDFQKGIELEEGWTWSMKEHLRRSFLYKNFQFTDDNENRELRPNKNIIIPILNVQYRTEGFDVKDIEIYVDDAEEYYKSFLVNKFHNRWAPEQGMDTFIDDVVECCIDYGGVLVRKVEGARPEVIDLRSLAFCNQRDILNYPFCIKHTLSPSELRDMPGWGESSNGANIDIESLLVLCKDEKEIVVYEMHGTLPTEYLGSEGEKKDVPQMQIVAYYKDQDKNEIGVTLFKKKMPKLPFKFLARDKIVNRALGRGGIEELFETQIWTNWNEIKITEMLEAASKMVNYTDDPTFSAKHPSGLKDIENHEVLVIGEGKKIAQIDNVPRNLVVFKDALDRWEQKAMAYGSANDPLLGNNPSSGTPFKLQELVTQQAEGIHKYRQGKLAVFMDEIYRDWIIPQIAKEITKDQNFLTELSMDELQKISETVMVNETNKALKEKVLNGGNIQLGEAEAFSQNIKTNFLKAGNKRFISILKGEFTDKKLGIQTNIVGKQKNLAMMTDKLVNVMRQFIASPQIKQDPDMVKLLNVILESSGMSPISFGATIQPQQQQTPQGGATVDAGGQGMGQLNPVNQGL